MLYLIAATLGSAFLVIILKIIKMRGENVTVAITVNYLLGALVAFVMSPVPVVATEIIREPWFVMSLIMGVAFMISLVIFAVSAEKSGVAITTILGRAAMAIPVIFAFVALGEKPTALKIALLVVILFSLWLIIKSDSSAKNTSTFAKGWSVVVLPVIVFLFNGFNDTIMQYTKRMHITDSADNMNFTGTLFVAAAITGLVFYFFENRCRMPLPSFKSVVWGLILGVSNIVCIVSILYALERMDGSVFYPLYYAGAVVICTVAGVVIFREKLTFWSYVGIALALSAIIILASI